MAWQSMLTQDIFTGPTWAAVPKVNDGSIERVDLNGRNRTTIVPEGATFTPKQIHLDKENGKLYWSDREGMRVMRANLDGSNIETLVRTGPGDADRPDATKWCVGIAIDPKRRKVYWTQKGPDDAGLGRIFRANIEIPKGETPGQSQRHRSLVRSPSGAHRSGTGSFQSRYVLDRSRRSAAWQHRESRIRGYQVRTCRRLCLPI